MPRAAETLTAIAYGEVSVLETLADMSLDTLKRSGLDEKTYLMVRVAGLVALDAPPVSYAMNLDAAVDNLEVEELQGILIALAPVIGSARVASAASNFLEVFLVDDDGRGIDVAADDIDEPMGVWMYDRTSERAVRQNAEPKTVGGERELETA